ncbi:MAG: hypothetical protein J5758_07190 [Abditibacteriota bacterium]|nr:hypothetical protein [Abditibacteriota bacterium]
MISAVRNYLVTPSVLPADRETEVRVHPTGENTAFTPGSAYTVRIYGENTGTLRFDRMVFSEYTVTPDEKGDLVFSHAFLGEQKHIIKILRPDSDRDLRFTAINYGRRRRPSNDTAVLPVYSLAEDLYGMRAWKGELHCHTILSDGEQDVCHTVGNYRAGGFDFLAITDHYLMEPSEEALEIFRDAPVSMTLTRGEEVHHQPTERIHAVNFGGRDSVNRYWRNHPDRVKAEAEAIMAELPPLPDSVDREDYAYRVWCSRKTHEFGGLSLLCHPHWIWADMNFVPDFVTEQLIRDRVYDCLELTNNTTNDMTVDLWSELRSRGADIPVVGCSDSHNTNLEHMERPAARYSYVMAKSRDTESLIEAVKAGRSAAVDAADRRIWVFGPYRIAKFARFIADAFDPVYQKLCEPQGFLLAEYYDKQPDTDTLLRLHDARSEEYARSFYGY